MNAGSEHYSLLYKKLVVYIKVNYLILLGFICLKIQVLLFQMLSGSIPTIPPHNASITKTKFTMSYLVGLGSGSSQCCHPCSSNLCTLERFKAIDDACTCRLCIKKTASFGTRTDSRISGKGNLLSTSALTI